MTPLDDELRSLLHSRADAVAPAPDPLGGIERRAKRMRRNRLAASVAGAAMTVAAIAVAVPSLVPDRGGNGSTFATTRPSPSSLASFSPAPQQSAGTDISFDPQHPWAFRGDRTVLDNGNLETFQADFATRHADMTLYPLYGHVYEPSQRPEVVFVATGGGAPRWGVVTTSESGPDFLVDEPVTEFATALMTVLPGDEVRRLLVVASPRTGQIEYATNGVDFKAVSGPAPGIGFVPLEGDTTNDQVRVLGGDGAIDDPIFLGPAPDAPTPPTIPAARPDNYLAWPSRGRVETVAAFGNFQAYFASAMGRPGEDQPALVEYHPLYSGTDGSIRYTVGQAWFRGDTEAHTFGWALDGPDGHPEPFLGPLTPKDAQLVAYLVSRPSNGTDLLVVIPRIGAGRVSYSPDATSPFVQKANGRSENSVAVIDRDPKATSDRVEALDGDGMKVLYRGPVQPLLCGASGCG